MVGGWRRLLNEELHNLYFSPINYSDQVKEDQMVRACSWHGEDREYIQSFSGKARRKQTSR
jgi:hypothetical protein